MHDRVDENALALDRSVTGRPWEFPRRQPMLQHAFRSVAAVTIRAWLRLYHRFAITGLENLPLTGSFVMVANHSSHLDALCLLSALPLHRLHQAFPAAAADYFYENLPRRAVSALVVNALPFDRQIHARQSIALCRKLLAQPGNILIVFPEGTRSATGIVGAFRPGIGLLLAGSHVPVVPCYLSGANHALPKGAWLPRPRSVQLTLGKSRSFEDYSPNKDSLRQLCVELRRSVLDLAPGTLCEEDRHSMTLPQAPLPGHTSFPTEIDASARSRTLAQRSQEVGS
jgi:1-acyl-sn-glycerol-3-phosphate acyltransferase